MHLTIVYRYTVHVHVYTVYGETTIMLQGTASPAIGTDMKVDISVHYDGVIVVELKPDIRHRL